MQRTLLVTTTDLSRLASILSGYGSIQGIDHEGTITWTLDEDDAFELGRTVNEVEHELKCYFTGIEIVSPKRGK